MEPVSESLSGQTPDPAPGAEACHQEPSVPSAAAEQSESPAVGPAVYSGPERRAQGYLVAEILTDYPAVEGHAPAFHRPR